ncbi:MAG: DUF2058 domain-containing protein [Proteobacteria bacterium]|nr:DUF2058 domain-containing protein [Desulfobacula sp.]MBU3954616.1 DUF2058 domain-containing protein [Pseudomonadota bacterium]MBU4131085.1 DUF2058 domain-containing protein [Pseudomonadota bacterium]
MGTSFKDQLLKAGLVNKKQVQKAGHEKNTNRKKNKGQSASPEENKTRQEQLAKEKHNIQLNLQLNAEKQRLENLSQARQLIETNRLPLEDYDEPYYFAMGKKIKKLFVTEEIAKKLSFGQLAIVKLDESFQIVPARVAHQIASRDPESLVVLNTPES